MTRNIMIAFWIWNLVVALIYAADKRRARLGLGRIREITLILCAYLLGAYGAIMGMVIFNHKTSKIKFRLLVPLAAIAETVALVLMRNMI